MRIRKAIIPAAGLGTRFLPATKAQPKEMLPIVDKPTIQYIVEEAAASGIEDILIVTGRGKRAIEDHFDKSYELESELVKKEKYEWLKIVQDISNIADIHYVRQGEALGLVRRTIDRAIDNPAGQPVSLAMRSATARKIVATTTAPNSISRMERRYQARKNIAASDRTIRTRRMKTCSLVGLFLAAILKPAASFRGLRRTG
jgi:hypothetical protein